MFLGKENIVFWTVFFIKFITKWGQFNFDRTGKNIAFCAKIPSKLEIKNCNEDKNVLKTFLSNGLFLWNSKKALEKATLNAFFMEKCKRPFLLPYCWTIFTFSCWTFSWTLNLIKNLIFQARKRPETSETNGQMFTPFLVKSLLPS